MNAFVNVVKTSLIIHFLLEHTTTWPVKSATDQEHGSGFTEGTSLNISDLLSSVTDQPEETNKSSVNVLHICSMCDPFGTLACANGTNEASCVCKPHWEGTYCRQAPDQCNLTKLNCGEHGHCTSEVDIAVCTCDDDYTGEHCQIAKNKISFNSENSVSLLSETTICALILIILELTMISLRGVLAMHCPCSDQSTQKFCQTVRSLAILLASLVVLLFQHPAIFNISAMECKIWFYVATICFSIGIGSFAMEALSNELAVRTEQRCSSWSCNCNDASQGVVAKPFPAKMLPIALLSFAITIPYFSQYGQVTSSWSCLGRFNMDAIDFWYPIVLLNFCAAFGASVASYCTFFVEKNLPQLIVEESAFHEINALIGKYLVESCQLEAVITTLGPWVLLGLWLTLAISSEFLFLTSVSSAALVFSFFYAICSAIQLILTTPILYSKAIQITSKLLPERFSSPLDPVNLMTREEVLQKRHGRKLQTYLTEYKRKLLQNSWMEAFIKSRLEQENSGEINPIYDLYIGEYDNHNHYGETAAVREQCRCFFREWANQTMLTDPQGDTLRNIPPVKTDFAEEEHDEVFENLGIGLPKAPSNPVNHSKYWLALDSYLNEMKWDPFQICPLLIINQQGNTTEKTFLRTPMSILCGKVLDELIQMENVVEDETEGCTCGEAEKVEAKAVDEFDPQWMMSKEDKIQMKLKNYSDAVWLIISQNWDYLERSKAMIE
ncbi:hypothetical protein V3C99_009313 [Haemonchus contortus]